MSSYCNELAPPPLLLLLICLFVHVGPLYSASSIQSSLPSSRVLTSRSQGSLAATDLVQIVDLPVSSTCLCLGPDNVEALTLAQAERSPQIFNKCESGRTAHWTESTTRSLNFNTRTINHFTFLPTYLFFQLEAPNSDVLCQLYPLISKTLNQCLLPPPRL